MTTDEVEKLPPSQIGSMQDNFAHPSLDDARAALASMEGWFWWNGRVWNTSEVIAHYDGGD